MTWEEQDHRREMANDVLREIPVSPIVRLPDPEDYTIGSLEREMARRLQDKGLDAIQREAGRELLQWHDAQQDAFVERAEAFLAEAGWPTPEVKYDWDEETDWREDKW